MKISSEIESISKHPASLLLLGGTGYALEPSTEPSLLVQTGTERQTDSVIDDIRDGGKLKGAMLKAKPDIVLHLAARPIVRTS